METNSDITTLEAEANALLAEVKDGKIVLDSIAKELSSIEVEADTVEAELAKIDEEFERGEEEQKKEESAMLAEMEQDAIEEEAEDAIDAE